MPLFCYTTFNKKHRGGEEDNGFFSMQKHFFFFMQNIFSMIILLKNIFFFKIHMTIKQIIMVQNKIDNFIKKNILIFLM
jgi:hypothetical protein